jgi:hypothetical protein
MNNKSTKTATYQSKGMKLVQGRLTLHNNINNQKCSIEVVDKKDDNNKCLGTSVVVNFKQEA